MAEDSGSFEALLDYLKRNRGFDFTGYKRPSLQRRVQRRMQQVGLDEFSEYVDYLELHPDEFVSLFNTILINVTGFYRDPQIWEYLRSDILPRILGNKNAGEPIRVWSGGCATGEESYTLAILLAEALGLERFREQVKIYATDVDEEALNVARQAAYSASQVADVPDELREKYFEVSGARHIFNKDVRRSVIFGRHDLIQDAPISRVDLLLCRNTLMYFNAETQARILDRFHFALNPLGYLVLGRAEMLLTQGSAFTPIDLRRRVFARAIRSHLRERLRRMSHAGGEELGGPMAGQVRLREAAFDASTVAELVLDHNNELLLANERARELFGLTGRDLGRSFSDLDVSYRPVELRSQVELATRQARTVHIPEAKWATLSGDVVCFHVQVVPLLDPAGVVLGASILFEDVTGFKRLELELQHAHEELETAYEELQATNEELETTNEELQSTVEELETTNEELQSTNEELETMNEELQSTNEELHTINEQVRERSDELDEVNVTLASILSSFESGVIVLDSELRIMLWNSQAEDMWGLRSEEVTGKSFFTLDIGLPVQALHQPIRESMNNGTGPRKLVLQAHNRRGRPIECDIICSPMRDGSHGIKGVVLLMSEQTSKAATGGDGAA